VSTRSVPDGRSCADDDLTYAFVERLARQANRETSESEDATAGVT
jgi:hypothetical protein